MTTEDEKIEAIARALARADGVNPETMGFPLTRELAVTTRARLIPVDMLQPAWTLYTRPASAVAQLIATWETPSIAATDDWIEWIEWRGGKCPVKAEVQIRYRDGKTSIRWAPGCMWAHTGGSNAENDIVAYRVVKE